MTWESYVVKVESVLSGALLLLSNEIIYGRSLILEIYYGVLAGTHVSARPVG